LLSLSLCIFSILNAAPQMQPVAKVKSRLTCSRSVPIWFDISHCSYEFVTFSYRQG
jgi:hypothetical protein